MNRAMPLPDHFDDATQLEDVLSRPSEALIEDLAKAPGAIMVLGVGGKMGPTLARMAKRADPDRRVIGVARFSEPGLREHLQGHGVECIAADLLEREALAALPEAPNVVFMAGRKFGSTGNEALTWAMNGHVPALVAERFARSRIVVFSTACVYPFVETGGAGAIESFSPLSPIGEYANSCVARERMFEYFSQRHRTPGRLLRLSYAIDMRYGVLRDVAEKVLRREPIDLGMGHANVIWQGEANERALRALAHCEAPMSPLNLSGPKISIREIAAGLGRRLQTEPVFTGSEAPSALLVDCSEADRLFGAPEVGPDTMLDWTADWIRRGGESLGKPTHYEARDGKY
jgi:nucleoside-diphosphate-sugar epimerase